MIEFDKKNFRSWSIMGMGPCLWSIAFPEIINENNSFVLTADLTRYSGLNRIKENYSDHFINVGIAEQNMVGIAAGMAMTGKQVFMTTYAPFMTYRCGDQIRHLLGNMNLNIKAIGSAAGLSAGFSGNALLAVSDIAFMRSIPNMTVLSPADCTEVIKMLLAVSKIQTPVYIRYCGTVNIPCIYKEDYNFEIGKIIELQNGEDIAILATGTNIVKEALNASKLLEENYNIKPTVANVHTIKPLDSKYVKNVFKTHSLVITIEEHSVIGGLGSAVSELMANYPSKAKQVILGVEDKIHLLGSRDYMLSLCGLKAENIAERILNEYKKGEIK